MLSGITAGFVESCSLACRARSLFLWRIRLLPPSQRPVTRSASGSGFHVQSRVWCHVMSAAVQAHDESGGGGGKEQGEKRRRRNRAEEKKEKEEEAGIEQKKGRRVEGGTEHKKGRGRSNRAEEKKEKQ